MIKAIQHNCARSEECTIAVLEMGVERMADEVCLMEPPRNSGGFRISCSAYEIGQRK